jgi:lysophospholipase L1-like esterase
MWAKTVIERLLLVMSGVIVGLVLLEAHLQLVAAFNGRAGPIPEPGSSGNRRVISLGDSNTYGIWVGKPAAYPQVLERLWNAAPGGQRLEVANLGYPGNNSSLLLSRFGEILHRYRPDVVTIMVGVNDFWTLPEPVADSADTCALRAAHPLGSDYRERLWQYSRVYRLLYMIAMWPGGRSLTGGVEHWAAALQANLAAMATCARRVGAEPIVLTYPSHSRAYAAANAEIRKAAATLGIRLVDISVPFTDRCPNDKCSLLYDDQHPMAEGHELAARAILPVLRDVLDGSAHRTAR